MTVRGPDAPTRRGEGRRGERHPKGKPSPGPSCSARRRHRRPRTLSAPLAISARLGDIALGVTQTRVKDSAPPTRHSSSTWALPMSAQPGRSPGAQDASQCPPRTQGLLAPRLARPEPVSILCPWPSAALDASATCVCLAHSPRLTAPMGDCPVSPSTPSRRPAPRKRAPWAPQVPEPPPGVIGPEEGPGGLDRTVVCGRP